MSSPKNSLRSRNNSSSSARSICNSIHLSRQNTFPTRRKMNSMSSAGSVLMTEDYKQNNLSEAANDDEEGSIIDEEDPDAMDEAVSMKMDAKKIIELYWKYCLGISILGLL